MPRVVMLHSIGPDQGRFRLSADRFALLTRMPGRPLFSLDDGYADNYVNAHDILLGLGERAVIFLVAGKIGGRNDWDATGGLAGQPLLDWAQIKELRQAGVRFGSHGLTHRDLRHLGDDALKMEVSSSKQLLEDALGEEIDLFAYPHGMYDEKVVTAVQEAGYKRAYRTDSRFCRDWRNRYKTMRTEIGGRDSDFSLWCKTAGLDRVQWCWQIPQLTIEKVKMARHHGSGNT